MKGLNNGAFGSTSSVYLERQPCGSCAISLSNDGSDYKAMAGDRNFFDASFQINQISSRYTDSEMAVVISHLAFH